MHRRSDTKSKDLLRQLEEEKGNSQRLQDQLNQLNGRVRSLRRDKEDAEGEAESLQKKLKQAKAAAEDAEETSSMLQAQINKLRAAARKPKVRHVLVLSRPSSLRVLLVLLCTGYSSS